MSQLKELFKEQGLTVHMHTRRKGLKYVYASWREEGKVKQVYFAPWSRVEQMTREQVQDKLATIQKTKTA